MEVWYINKTGSIESTFLDSASLDDVYRELDEIYEYWADNEQDCIDYLED